MTDIERDVRNMMQQTAGGLHYVPRPSRGLIRRARLRQARTTLFAGAVGVALVLGGFAATSAVSTDAAPVRPADPRPAPVASGALAYALGGDIYVADPEGSNAVEISDGIPDAQCEGLSEYSIPSWSPDGRYVAFQRDCASPRQTDVVITDPHGDVVGEFPAYGGGWGFTWSPDSTRIAVWEPALTIGVYGVDGERQASLPEPTVTGGATSAAPGWMPDGSALLLYGYAVMPLDASAGHELSRPTTYSPDGTRVAVDTGNSVAVYDADGSAVSEVDGLNGSVDAWSPDGERFASLSDDGERELNVVDVASGTVTVLTEARAVLDGDEILGVRGFSPQGDRILYATGDGVGGHTALWSIGVDGSDARLLVAGTTQGEWRPR